MENKESDKDENKGQSRMAMTAIKSSETISIQKRKFMATLQSWGALNHNISPKSDGMKSTPNIARDIISSSQI